VAAGQKSALLRALLSPECIVNIALVMCHKRCHGKPGDALMKINAALLNQHMKTAEKHFNNKRSNLNYSSRIYLKK
jgi:hypothetical protein